MMTNAFASCDFCRTAAFVPDRLNRWSYDDRLLLQAWYLPQKMEALCMSDLFRNSYGTGGMFAWLMGPLDSPDEGEVPHCLAKHGSTLTVHGQGSVPLH